MKVTIHVQDNKLIAINYIKIEKDKSSNCGYYYNGIKMHS